MVMVMVMVITTRGGNTTSRCNNINTLHGTNNNAFNNKAVMILVVVHLVMESWRYTNINKMTQLAIIIRSSSGSCNCRARMARVYKYIYIYIYIYREREREREI